MSNKDKIIKHYKVGLVDNYENYLKVIDELNSQIPLLAEELSKTTGVEEFDPNDVELFTYPTFCVSFLENLDLQLSKNENFTKSTINNIFMVMVEDKIVESSFSLSSNESKALGSEYES